MLIGKPEGKRPDRTWKGGETEFRIWPGDEVSIIGWKFIDQLSEQLLLEIDCT
jgi:hypothetical protein